MSTTKSSLSAPKIIPGKRALIVTVISALVILLFGVHARMQSDARVMSGGITYTFNCGSGDSEWSNASRWSPFYPGTTINTDDTAILNCGGHNNTAITVNGKLQLNYVGYVPGWTQGAPFTFNDGSVFTNNALWLSNGSTYTAHPGATIINNDRLDVAGLILEAGATLNNDTPTSELLFSNGGTMTGDLTNGSGIVNIGTSTSDILSGSFNNGTGTYRIQYFSFFGPTQVGKLTVGGSATLGGTFDFTSPFPFGAPTEGEQFVVLEAVSGINGAFTNSFVDFGPGLRANISYTATQAIITIGGPPPQTFVVTKTADTDDGECDADCSLREALTAANSTPAADTVNFDIPASDVGCNGGAGPCTILLGAVPAPPGIGIGQLQIAESVTLNGPIAPALPVVVDGQNANRVFLVSNGTAFINNLTAAHAGTTGAFSSGGGLFVNGASTATVTGMTFRDNNVTGAKGGGAGVNLGGTLNIYNSTFSNNTAVIGGALFNESGGTLNLVNVTVVGNTAIGGGAGGLDTQDQTTSIRNSIIANNSVTNISGAYADLGNNITDGDPLVGPLQDNGGPTFTQALLNGSPAIDAGNDCVVTDMCVPTYGFPVNTDQRGLGRSQGAHVDIGAVESATLVISSDQTIPGGNYESIAIDPGVNATLGGIVKVSSALTVDCTAQLSGGSATNYVVGSLRKNFCAGGSFFFPVGSAAGYAPVTVNAAGSTFPGDFTVKANDETLAGTVVSQSLTRNWTLTRNNISQADITFNYNDADVPAGADESAFKFVRRSGTTDIAFTPSSFDINTNTFTLLGVTGFSDWGLGKVAAPTAATVPVSGRILTADGRGIRGVYITLTGQNGVTRTVISSSFGYYQFNDVEVGQIYVLSVAHKRYFFTDPQRLIAVMDTMNGQDFVAEP